MAQGSRAARAARFIVMFTALALPTLTLVPLGALYLWEKGWVLPWAIAACIVVAVMVALQRHWLDAPARPNTEVAARDGNNLEAGPVGAAGYGHATPAERRAWREIRAISAQVNVEDLQSAESALALGQRTVDAVARSFHAGKTDAIWQFTLPEALAIIEQVSARLGVLVGSTIPFGDRLTVAQFIGVYRWRHLVGVAEKAYDIWRLVRLVNPATAVTAEARERMSRAMLQWGREHIARRFAAAFVEEVGRAAIDLYSGRLHAGADVATARVAPVVREAIPADPLSVVVIGSAQDRDAVAYAVERVLIAQSVADRAAPVYEVETSDAINEAGFNRRRLQRAIAGADLVVWALPLQSGAPQSGAPQSGAPQSGAPQGDVTAFDLLSRHFERSPRLLAPALVVALLADASRVDDFRVDDVAKLAATAGKIIGGFEPALPGSSDLASDARGTAPNVAVIPIATSPELSASAVEELAAAIQRSEPRARHVRALRERAANRRSSLVNAGGKAVAAAGSLAGMLWRNGGGRTGA